MKKNLHLKVLASFAGLLLGLAPIFSMKMGCAIYWGEQECPECLKNPS